MIHAWHIPIMGFTQTPGRLTGIEEVWQSIRHVSNDRTSVVTPLVWDADFTSLAEFIFRNSEPAPKINVYAYSWGAGYGFLKLADALSSRNLTVDHAVLCDPVYRPTLVTFLFLSLTKIPRITIPANVRRVSWFRQTKSIPRGHDLIAADPSATTIGDAIQLNYDHAHIDNSWEFIAKCRSVANQQG